MCLTVVNMPLMMAAVLFRTRMTIAYRGGCACASAHEAPMTTAQDQTAKDFFERDFVRRILEAPERYRPLQGVLGVSVSGQGKWTIRLGDLDTPVAEGFPKNADVKVWFLGDSFTRFLD